MKNIGFSTVLIPVKGGSLFFKTEGVVSHSVGFTESGFQTLAGTPIPKHGFSSPPPESPRLLWQ